MTPQSSAGALDVRAVCQLSPWQPALPEVSRTLAGSAFLMEADRRVAGVEGRVLALVSEESSQLWTFWEPPVLSAATPACQGWMFPFDIGMIKADNEGIPGLAQCDEE